MKKRLDTTYFGAALGLVMPFVFGLLFLKSVGIPLEWWSLKSLLRTPSMMVKLLCVILFPDMGGVFVLNSMEMWKACKGMFGAIGIYAIFGIVIYCIV